MWKYPVLFASKYWLLAGLVIVFFVKGLLFSTLLPIFQGPDEQIHYATIQHRAEPEDKTWDMKPRSPGEIADGENIASYHFSEEVTRTAQMTRFDEIKWEGVNRQAFTPHSPLGPGEDTLIRNDWKRYIDTYPTLTSGTASAYYSLSVLIENYFSSQNILFRFFSLRIFSVILGCGIVIMSYCIAKNSGFSSRHALLLTGIIAFQPMFATTAAMVNIDIMLIFAFTAYLWGVTFLFRHPHSKAAKLIVLASTVLAIFSKGPGLILVPITAVLALFGLYQTYAKHSLMLPRYLLFGLVGLLLAGYFLLPSSVTEMFNITGGKSAFSSPVVSLTKYLDKTLSSDSILNTETSYWGNFGWLDTEIPEEMIHSIWYIEILAFSGIFYALFIGKTPYPAHLPRKKYLFFFLGLILTLQLAIRFYDWRAFSAAGTIVIGTPGRYFLPNITAHILLLFTGLGYIVKTERRFDWILKAGFIGTVLLTCYAIAHTLIPRYYL